MKTGLAVALSILFHAVIGFWLWSNSTNSRVVLQAIDPAEVHLEDKPPRAKTAPLAKEFLKSFSENVPDRASEAWGEQSIPVSAPLVRATDSGLRVPYPRLSRLMGEEGRTLIEIGSNRTARISLSSGFARLDEAALESVRSALEDGRLALAERPRSIEFIFKLTGN